MAWEPLSESELDALIARHLAACSPALTRYYERVAIPPMKWRQSPWGNEGGGFWAIATDGPYVLWYNDIEDGFNVSRFVVHRTIPDDGYWCNQDDLDRGLQRLREAAGST